MKAFTASEQANSFAWLSDVYPTISAQVPSDTSNIQYGVIEQGYCSKIASGLTAGVASSPGVNAPGRRREDDTNLVIAPTLMHHHPRNNGGEQLVVTHALSAEGADASEDGTGRGTPLTVAYRKAQKPHDPEDGERWEQTECRDTLSAHGTTTASVVVAFTERTRAEGRTLESQEETAYALTNPGEGGRTQSRQIAGDFGVRRLMPIECERLQGLPDRHTEGLSDSARYRLIGNSVAVPVIEWIGRRIFHHFQNAAEEVV